MRLVTLKIPFEKGNPTGKKGPAEAPDKIAKGLHGEKIDVPVSEDFEDTMYNITEQARKKWKKNNFILSLGGDHSITYALVRAAAQTHKDLSLIYFDAHLDCEDDFLPPSHEDVLKAIVNEGFVKPENILVIGARKWWPKEIAFVMKHQIRVVQPTDIDIIKEFLKKSKKIYVSLDIDVFDPVDAPGTNYPEKEGPRASDLFAVLKLISGFKGNIGLDICEVVPSLDFNNKTLATASSAAWVFLTTGE